MAVPPPGRFDSEVMRRARLTVGLSQAQLAAAIGADRAAVKSWETGGVQPTVNNLARLAAVLGLDVRDLHHAAVGSLGSLADLRVAAGLTQRQLSDRLEVSQTQVTRWERGLRRPTEDEITRYAAVLGVERRVVAEGEEISRRLRE